MDSTTTGLVMSLEFVRKNKFKKKKKLLREGKDSIGIGGQ